MATMFNSMAHAMGQPLNLLQKPAAPIGGPSPSFMSGLTSVMGGLSTLARGRAESAAIKSEARALKAEASEEELAGQNQVLNLMRNMNADLAGIMAASGASGTDPTRPMAEAFAIGGENISNSQYTTKARAAGLRGQAVQKKFEARQSVLASRMDATYQAASYFERNQRRG